MVLLVSVVESPLSPTLNPASSATHWVGHSLPSRYQTGVASVPKCDEFRRVRVGDRVRSLRSLSTDEKQEIQLLLKQYLREERREEIYGNLKSAQVEQQKGELKFSSNINEQKTTNRGVIVEVSFSSSFKRAFKKRIKGNCYSRPLPCQGKMCYRGWCWI